ncbi:PadR family transcriptional regulator [Phenylobacterium sp. LjRoot219]|uniref:PadR family transcriptional regulator n=1 Tax=Phenylobacterium sp. LjRoot219 TaxID=3342283 RepID=UPI003ECD7C1B
MRNHRHHGHEGRRGRGGAEEGFGREGHGGRRRRMFDSTELRLVLLSLIAEQPRHGYDLIREVEARTGGAYAPSPGVVYPMTTLLLDMGLIEETGGETARKLFAITEAGRADLAAHEAEAQAAFAKLQMLAEVRGRTDAAPVARAMQNLKTAVHNRLSQEGVDKAIILEVAALIDQAASNVERL